MFPASPKAGSEETTSEVPVSVSVDVDLEVENNLEAEGDFCATQGDCEDCRIKSRIEVDKGKGEDEDMISNSGRLFSRDSKDNGDSRESNNLDVADFGVMVPVKAGKQGNLTLATPKLKPQVTLVSDCAITGENAVGLTPKRREDEEKQAVVFKQESEDAHKVFEKKPHPSSDAQNHLFVEQKLAPGYGMDFPQLSMEAKENTVDPMRQDARNRTWAKIVALNNGEATASEAQGTFCLEQRRPSSESALGRSRLWWCVPFLRIFGEALCVTWVHALCASGLAWFATFEEYGNGCGVKAGGILPPNSGIITSPPLAFGVFGGRAAINLPAFGSAAKGGQLDIYLLGPACWARKAGLLV
ncbi:hypothetical protein U1Q18_009836 [Sarracenia purpurea var. burkii]